MGRGHQQAQLMLGRDHRKISEENLNILTLSKIIKILTSYKFRKQVRF